MWEKRDGREERLDGDMGGVEGRESEGRERERGKGEGEEVVVENKVAHRRHKGENYPVAIFHEILQQHHT